MILINNFLDCFERLKQHAVEGHFEDVENPIDGVVYPGICQDIPDAIRSEVLSKLEALKGCPVIDPVMFMRRSRKGVHAPNQVHNDISHGKFSCMVYINEQRPGAGTSLVSHKETGLQESPTTDEELRTIERDKNTPDKWDIDLLVNMKPNTGCIFPAGRLHRAEPVGGFGTTEEDSRVVLTCFFS
jgi:hypothetical protein